MEATSIARGMLATIAVGVATAQSQFEYTTSSEALTWKQARAFCKYDFYGDVATITDRAEWDEVHNTHAPQRHGYWIGMVRDKNDRDAWRWVDGSVFSGNIGGEGPWQKKEPNNWGGKEDCVAASRTKPRDGSDKYWNDATCETKYFAVCRRLKQPTSTMRQLAMRNKWVSSSDGRSFYKYFNHVLGGMITPESHGRQTWNSARINCESLLNGKGQLASINTEAELQEIMQILYSSDGVYKENVNRPIWLGAKKNSGAFTSWIDGSSISADVSSNFIDNEPNNVEERCLQMGHSYTASGDSDFKSSIKNDGSRVAVQALRAKPGQWNDADCNKLRGYLCEVHV